MQTMNGYKDKSDGILVEMTLLGNNKAFEELVIRYEGKVKGTAYKFTKNRFSAEDASQDAFVCAWVKLDSLKDRSKFGSWVCSIAKNCALSLVRHYSHAYGDISFETLENAVLSGSGNNADIAEPYRQDTELCEAVEALSEKNRETVKLHYFEEMSVEDIAKKKNIPIGTVKWRLAQGRKRLRKEYGVMENNGNCTMVQKVMDQVEQLKRWNLKKDKTGFESVYRQLLKKVEAMEESKQKYYAMAEVLARGYWWISGERSDEMLSSIKISAEKSFNEDIMMFIICAEWSKYKDSDRIKYMEEVQAPYLIQNGFKKALGYLYFWLAYECCEKNLFEKGIGYFKKVTDSLLKSDGLYAAALAAIRVEEKIFDEGIPTYSCRARGETLEYIGGRLILDLSPGFGRGEAVNSDVFSNCACCDSIIYDEKIKAGDGFTANDENIRLIQLKEGKAIAPSEEKARVICKSKGVRVETPSGVYENCTCYIFEGDYYGLKYCETYFCRKVGIVKQIVEGNGKREEWLLYKRRIDRGDEIIPFSEGNRWGYCLAQDTDERFDTENVFEIVHSDSRRAVISSYCCIREI